METTTDLVLRAALAAIDDDSQQRARALLKLIMQSRDYLGLSKEVLDGELLEGVLRQLAEHVREWSDEIHSHRREVMNWQIPSVPLTITMQ